MGHGLGTKRIWLQPDYSGDLNSEQQNSKLLLLFKWFAVQMWKFPQRYLTSEYSGKQPLVEIHNRKSLVNLRLDCNKTAHLSANTVTILLRDHSVWSSRTLYFLDTFCLVFKRSDNVIRPTIWIPDILDHKTDYLSISRPFDNWTHLDHLNTRLVWY